MGAEMKQRSVLGLDVLSGGREMLKARRITVGTFLVLLTLSAYSSAADPAGELYWKTVDYPVVFFLYTTTDTYNGAEVAIDYACEQNAGSPGTYSGNVRIWTSSSNFPAEKTGSCLNTRPFFPGTFEGKSYTAHLFCNGVQRDWLDDSPCQPPVVSVNNGRNLGPPCETATN